MSDAPAPDQFEALRARPRRLLVVLPHPDDESYGLAGTLCRAADDPDAAVVLMTLTRGEAAVAGLERGQTPEEQGMERSDRMRRVAEIIGLDALILRDWPDRNLAFIDPRPVEAEVRDVLRALRPNVLITFGARGINAHPDHIATHGIVRRAVLECRDEDPAIARRFATVTVPQSVADSIDRLLFGTPDDQVGCVLDVAPWAERKEECLVIHEAYVTVTGDGSDGRIARPPVEFLRLWDEPLPNGPLGDVFEGLETHE